MRILFLCGSLEPGRDGVGDYTRRLACELIRQGHECQIVALNDCFACGFSEGTQDCDGISVKMLRLASTESWGSRMKHAKLWISGFTPDWISLQFVPYSFNPKGLPLHLGRRLRHIGGDAKWHLMFHELWIGMVKDSVLKEQLVGRVQRWLIKKLIHTLSPRLIHTQTLLYKSLLEKERCVAELLPLFGNIPLIMLGRKSILPSSEVRLIVFGGIHSGAPIVEFARDAAAYSHAQSTSVQLVFLGRCGTEKEAWIKAWRSAGLPFLDHGSCRSEDVSAHLIATTPSILLGKSGSAAAMREHGLPVISVSRKWQMRGIEEFPLPSGITRYEPGSFYACMKGKAGVAITPEQISEQFLKDLARF
jgi:hypothetical protein